MPTFLLTFNKRQQLIHLRHQLAVAPQNLAGLIEPNLAPIQEPMRFRQAIDYMRREVMTLECHDVDASRPSRRTFAQHERWHVVQHAA
jgi:hypothetical protein